MDFSSGYGVAWGRKGQQLVFALSGFALRPHATPSQLVFAKPKVLGPKTRLESSIKKFCEQP